MATIILLAPLVGALICGFGWRFIGEKPAQIVATSLVFQLAGLVLLVAMIGAIVLTLRHRTDVKRQNVLHQMWRDPAKQMELKDVKPGQGL